MLALIVAAEAEAAEHTATVRAARLARVQEYLATRADRKAAQLELVLNLRVHSGSRCLDVTKMALLDPHAATIGAGTRAQGRAER